MSLDTKYKVVETESRGKVVVAAKDLMPGEVILHETDPLLFMSTEMIERCKRKVPPNEAIMCAGYLAYMKEPSTEKKEKVVSLFGPTTGCTAEGLRQFAKQLGTKKMAFDLFPCPLTTEEVEIFVQIGSILRLNMFCLDGKGYVVFDDITRFAHSCAANCSYHFEDHTCACRARDFIKAGEELTISYVETRDMEPIHKRRENYLKFKAFTCHCPRCDAPGDDTRQFDCFDPACKGVMMVCQPINQEPYSQPDLQYTGVEYVEPHLLPCTECHRAAPAEYQAEMFQLEETLLASTEPDTLQFTTLLARNRYSEIAALYQRVVTLKLPRYHGATIPHRFLRLRLLQAIYLFVGTHVRAAWQQIALEYLAVHEHIAGNPAHIHPSALAAVTIFCCSPRNPTPVMTPEDTKHYAQRALRLQLLQYGRENRAMPELDAAVEYALGRMAPSVSPDPDLCAFCKESPLRAAMKRSRCGACKKVMYCSAGCQKAHWKLHKKACKV